MTNHYYYFLNQNNNNNNDNNNYNNKSSNEIVKTKPIPFFCFHNFCLFFLMNFT